MGANVMLLSYFENEKIQNQKVKYLIRDNDSKINQNNYEYLTKKSQTINKQ